jgi:predicted alpha/beta superfamily hydrolase/RimJ/RimL family protein N-acetyltransferase
MVGDRVALRPLGRELFSQHVAWLSDPVVAWGVFGRQEGPSESEEADWLEREQARPDARLFSIHLRDGDRPVGVASLTNIGTPAGTATFRIYLGPAEDRGAGLGEDASRLVIRHAFSELGMDRVMLHVFEYNLAAQRLYARLGFRETERRRDRIHRDGRTWDVIVMALDRPASGWTPYETGAASTVVGDLRVLRGLRGPWQDAPRDILVHLPADAEASGRRYPVVYLQDGGNLFDEATSFSGEWRVDETLTALAREGLGIIAVGIPSPGDPARGAEYTPYRAKPWKDQEPYPSGLGSAYVRFLVEQVKPAVDAAFPTRFDRASTGVMGSSWGGLISLWAAIERGDVFGLLGAMSPAITPGQGPIYRRLRRLSPVPERVYLDMGDHEGSFATTPRVDRAWSKDGIRTARMVRDAIAVSLPRASGRLRYVEEAGGIHQESAWARRLPDALRFLFGDGR